LSFGNVAFIIVLATYQIDIYLNRHRVDKIISELYVYKFEYGNFPKNIQQISLNSETSYCNYIPDSSFKNFKNFIIVIRSGFHGLLQVLIVHGMVQV
jgi:hypothetical protein